MFGWESRWKAGEWLEVQSRQGSPEKGQSRPLRGSRCGRASAELQETGGVTRTGQPQDERPAPTRKRRERHFCPLWSRFWVGEGEGLRWKQIDGVGSHRFPGLWLCSAASPRMSPPGSGVAFSPHIYTSPFSQDTRGGLRVGEKRGEKDGGELFRAGPVSFSDDPRSCFMVPSFPPDPGTWLCGWAAGPVLRSRPS